jgi:hypothetical protein
MRKLLPEILLIAAVLALCVPPLLAQEPHVGATVGTVLSSGDGNGPSVHAEGRAVYDAVARMNFSLKAIGEYSAGREPKIYLGRAGVGHRFKASARAYYRDFYLELGLQGGRVKYEGAGGYAKFTRHWVFGGGYTLRPRPGSSLTFGYQWLPEANVNASLPRDNYQHRFLDGHSQARRLIFEGVLSLPEHSRGVLLVNATLTRSAYRRAASAYPPGHPLGPFPASAVVLGVGYGWKLF